MNTPTTKKAWQDFVDWDSPLTEDAFWQAVADANDLDYSEIADGDIAEWL
jgi:hypothetical protein